MLFGYSFDWKQAQKTLKNSVRRIINLNAYNAFEKNFGKSNTETHNLCNAQVLLSGIHCPLAHAALNRSHYKSHCEVKSIVSLKFRDGFYCNHDPK